MWRKRGRFVSHKGGQMIDVEDFTDRLLIWGIIGGAIFGMIRGAYVGFLEHGVGGAIAGAALDGVVGAVIGFFLSSLLNLVPYVIVPALLAGLVWLIFRLMFWLLSNTWNVGKP
jgi:hypothetical protein